MNASLRALLSGVIDYAGLFPPARLPLDQAVRNYARYRQEPDAWMLGRFVIPVPLLPEVRQPFLFSAIARGGDDRASLLDSLAADLKGIERFHAVDAVEVKGPLETESILGAAGAVLGSGAVMFYEISLADDWRPRLVAAAAAVAAFNTAYPEPRAAFKLRTGGLEASAFPTVAQVAFVLHACRNAGVPLKFTAGLHHPIRHFDSGVQTPMHGFVNVFTAGVLAHARRLEEEALAAAIADEDAAHFVFTDDGLHWREEYASTAEIAAARRELAISFGSCSFDEPRHDLDALGWM